MAAKYTMETKDGFLVNVPEEKLDSWQKAQAEKPVSEAQKAAMAQAILRRMQEMRGQARENSASTTAQTQET